MQQTPTEVEARPTALAQVRLLPKAGQGQTELPFAVALGPAVSAVGFYLRSRYLRRGRKASRR